MKSWTDKEHDDINTNTAKHSSLSPKDPDLQGQMAVPLLSPSPCAKRGRLKVKGTSAHQPAPPPSTKSNFTSHEKPKQEGIFSLT